mgnify:CR=1 FL=1
MSITAPIVTYSRHRMMIDGNGITTLVIFHNCPLRCKYCANPYTIESQTKTHLFTPQELFDKVKIDNLYFLATNGGITFGGGEPLLYPDFISEFHDICPDAWSINIETSLSIPFANIEKTAELVDMFYIDCKDSNPQIYKEYTGKDNSLMIENIKKLLCIIPSEKITLKLPLIPGYNTKEDVENSREFFKALGVTQFFDLTYLTPDQIHKETKQETV